VNRVTGQYSVSDNELLEIKLRAAALFAGVSGKELAIKVRGAPPEPAPAPPPPAKRPGGRGRFH
jgi:hypothetical protein